MRPVSPATEINIITTTHTVYYRFSISISSFKKKKTKEHRVGGWMWMCIRYASRREPLDRVTQLLSDVSYDTK
jgi:hypothetical protein